MQKKWRGRKEAAARPRYSPDVLAISHIVLFNLNAKVLNFSPLGFGAKCWRGFFPAKPCSEDI